MISTFLGFFPIEDINRRKVEFDTINKLANRSNFVPRALDFGQLIEVDKAYMVVTYLPGEDAEIALKDLTQKEQYDAGFLAGKELNKLHKLPAPSDYPSWYSVKKKKSDNYLK